jgi:hypothetical protein
MPDVSYAHIGLRGLTITKNTKGIRTAVGGIDSHVKATFSDQKLAPNMSNKITAS